ncbi:hypothetical protein LTR17_024501 [Elasticomyces elasticus]|nr:hypothetical protein LTR17_024501 [Elasticomyces elasticus]
MATTPPYGALLANLDGRSSSTPLLGFDRPLNAASWVAQDSEAAKRECNRFANALEDYLGNPLTRREYDMIKYMNVITERPGWQSKVFDLSIYDKLRWGQDFADLCKGGYGYRSGSGSSRSMFKYCITELRDYAALDGLHGFVPALDSTATVYKSDTLIDKSTKQSLQSAVKALEDRQNTTRDWRLDSKGLVLDLVDPSLYPLLYGRSLILPCGGVPMLDAVMFSGKGSVMPKPSRHERKAILSTSKPGMKDLVYSSHFQWLPAEVSLSSEGIVKLLSYINNLHPRESQDMYEAIEAIIGKVIPMWNASLSSIDHLGRPTRIKVPSGHCKRQRIWDDDPNLELRDEDEECLDKDWYNDDDYEWVYTQPEPESYHARKSFEQTTCYTAEGSMMDDDENVTSEDEEVMSQARLGNINLHRDFGGRNLQIIIKLMSVHLTPEKATFAGDSWHSDGHANEHICASAFYYYDSDNVADGRLAFRESVDSESLRDWADTLPYEGYEIRDLVSNIYADAGIDDRPTQQALGDVLIKEGRIIAFPNVFQHRVPSMQLKNIHRSGHCKVLALFLVDPHMRIPSTAHVPPQQKHWWSEMVLGLDRVADLPPELAELVLDSADEFPITLEEAKDLRVNILAEHKKLNGKLDEMMKYQKFGVFEL